jgi:hypothetical protein
MVGLKKMQKRKVIMKRAMTNEEDDDANYVQLNLVHSDVCDESKNQTMKKGEERKVSDSM